LSKFQHHVLSHFVIKHTLSTSEYQLLHWEDRGLMNSVIKMKRWEEIREIKTKL